MSRGEMPRLFFAVARRDKPCQENRSGVPSYFAGGKIS